MTAEPGITASHKGDLYTLGEGNAICDLSCSSSAILLLSLIALLCFPPTQGFLWTLYRDVICFRSASHYLVGISFSCINVLVFLLMALVSHFFVMARFFNQVLLFMIIHDLKLCFKLFFFKHNFSYYSCSIVIFHVKCEAYRVNCCLHLPFIYLFSHIYLVVFWC